MVPSGDIAILLTFVRFSKGSVRDVFLRSCACFFVAFWLNLYLPCEIELSYSISDWAEERVVARIEYYVAFAIHRAAEVLELRKNDRSSYRLSLRLP